MPLETFTPGQQLTAAQLNAIMAMLPAPQTATANVASAVGGTMYLVQPTGGGTVTITLPQPISGTVIGMKLNSASGTAILSHNATELIYGFDTLVGTSRGASSVSLTVPDTYVVVVADGTNWHEYGSLTSVPWKFYDTTLGSAANNFTISSIPAGFSSIDVKLFVRSTTAAGNDSVGIQFNGDTTTNHYNGQVSYTSGSGTGTAGGANIMGGTYMYSGDCAAANSPSGVFDTWHYVIPNYSDTSTGQTVVGTGMVTKAFTSGQLFTQASAGVWNQSGAVSSMVIFPTATSAQWAGFSRCIVTLFP